MITRNKHVAALAFGVAAAFSTQASAQALELYDTFLGARISGFPGKVINPALWDGWNSQGALDVEKKIAGGKAILKSVTYGGTDSNSGRTSGRSALAFPESVGELVTEIQASVQTSKLALTDCDANLTDNGRVLTPRIAGHWFSNNNTPADDEDLTGTMFASVEVRRLDRHDDISDPNDPLFELRLPNRLQVIAQVFHCSDHDCINGDQIGFKTLGIIRRGQKRSIRIKWDEGENRFEFQLQRNEPVTIGYESDLNQGPPPKFWKRIEHRGQPENCDLSIGPPAAQTVAAGEVRIFDVFVNPEAGPGN